MAFFVSTDMLNIFAGWRCLSYIFLNNNMLNILQKKKDLQNEEKSCQCDCNSAVRGRQSG